MKVSNEGEIKMKEKELKEDIVNLIKTFDMFLDDMWDRGSFCPEENKGDKKINDLVIKMKTKYIPSKIDYSVC